MRALPAVLAALAALAPLAGMAGLAMVGVLGAAAWWHQPALDAPDPEPWRVASSEPARAAPAPTLDLVVEYVPPASFRAPVASPPRATPPVPAPREPTPASLSARPAPSRRPEPGPSRPARKLRAASTDGAPAGLGRGPGALDAPSRGDERPLTAQEAALLRRLMAIRDRMSAER